jgi:hypothetical protein
MIRHIAFSHNDYWATLDFSTLPSIFTSNLDYLKKTKDGDNICLHCNQIVDELTMKTHWALKKHKNKEYDIALFYFQGKNNNVSFWCDLCSAEFYLTVYNLDRKYTFLEKHFCDNHKDVNWKTITGSLGITRKQKYDLMLSAPPLKNSQLCKFDATNYSINEDGYLYKCSESECNNLKLTGHTHLCLHLQREHEKIWNSFENPNGILDKNLNLFSREMSSLFPLLRT